MTNEDTPANTRFKYNKKNSLRTGKGCHITKKSCHESVWRASYLHLLHVAVHATVALLEECVPLTRPHTAGVWPSS